VTRGLGRLPQQYTRKEVGRILGLDARCLRYWERLRLVRPRARWGERFYNFGDLAAVRAIQQLTKNRIPAGRVRRAIRIVEEQFGAAPIESLRFFQWGRELLVIPPGAQRPFNPIRQQWALPFDAGRPASLHAMTGRTPEELFEMALDCESSPELFSQAAENYRRAIELAPHWTEAHINLGVVLYQMGRIEEARAEFHSAVQLDPLNGISQYNLGCVLEEQGEIAEAIVYLQRAARAMPAHADAHFNLALAYERSGERRLAREQWMLYLRFAPNGPWAEQARARMKQCTSRRKRSAPIPFPRKA
jgi:tetratricopeptide (TPR) repeat protein